MPYCADMAWCPANPWRAALVGRHNPTRTAISRRTGVLAMRLPAASPAPCTRRRRAAACKRGPRRDNLPGAARPQWWWPSPSRGQTVYHRIQPPTTNAQPRHTPALCCWVVARAQDVLWHRACTTAYLSIKNWMVMVKRGRGDEQCWCKANELAYQKEGGIRICPKLYASTVCQHDRCGNQV